jgi:hypothetical protein
MKKLLMIAAAALLSAPLLAQQAADPDKKVQGGAKLPPEWKARLDGSYATLDSVKWENTGGGFHVMTGPAGIFYPPQSMNGTYEVHATFTQVQPSDHPEAYGLFIGGADLQGPGQKYTYFLLNQDVQFLIKRRASASTPTVIDWTANAAIKKPDASRKMTNTLSIEVGKEKVRFLINGTEVSSQPLAKVDTNGIAGIRINHNLNVQVDGFGMKPATSH